MKNIPSIVPALLWSVILTILLCLPGEKIPSGGLFNIPHLDKPVHLFLFAILTITWSYFSWKKNGNLSYWWIALFSLAYGILMEFVQANFIPHRSFDIGDIIADAIGAAAGAWWSTKRYIKK